MISFKALAAAVPLAATAATPSFAQAPAPGGVSSSDRAHAIEGRQGQKATSAGDRTGSALPPRADIGGGGSDVGFGPFK